MAAITIPPALNEPLRYSSETDSSSLAVDPSTQAQNVNFPQNVGSLEASAFEGTKVGSGSNVLSTPPPALGGGQTGSVHYYDAMGRMQTLQNKEPFKAALMRSAEDGTSPAVPSASQGPTLTAAVKTINLDTRGNNTNLDQADNDLQAEAAKIQKDVATSGQKACKGGSDYSGETNLINRLSGMGVDHNRASTLARFLNDTNNNTGGNHNAQDESTVALAIAAYDKLNAAGSKEAANQVVDQLNKVADNFTDSVKTVEASDAYYTAMNALGGYVMQVSADAAVTSLSSSSAHSQMKIVPYPVVVD